MGMMQTLEWACSWVKLYFSWEVIFSVIEQFCRWSWNSSPPWVLSKLMLESLHFLTWKYARFPLAKQFWARWFFKGSACFNTTDTFTLSNHHSGIHFMIIVPLGSVDPHRKRLNVHHQLSEFAKTHIHQVSEAIQPSHPLSTSSPFSFNLSQHQGLFQGVSSSHQVAKVLELQLQLQHQSCQWIFRTDFL